MDKINHTFQELSQSALPTLLDNLTASEAYPINDLLGKKGVGVASVLKRIGKPKTDFRGLYIFIDETLPTNQQVIYTGISRKVISRLNQHVNIKNHFSASFAYKVAKEKQGYKGERAKFSTEHIATEQINLHNLKVKFIEIDDPLVRYIFEVYVAMYFNTAYNSFETS